MDWSSASNASFLCAGTSVASTDSLARSNEPRRASAVDGVSNTKRRGVATPCATATVPVAAGTRMPGVPENYGSLRIRHGGELGWHEGLDVTGVGAVSVNDTATQQAAGYALVGVDVGYTFALAASTRLQLSARVDNLGDRRYIGSVIVNDSNGRYFEPGPGRTWMLGARLVF